MTKLNQGNILSLEQKAFKKEEVTVTANGQDFKVVIDKDFKETEIAELFTELVERSDYARKQNVKFDITASILILLIKHFTDIEFVKYDTVGQNYNIEVRTLNALINLGLFEQIISHFDKEAVSKIETMFEKHKAGVRKLADDMVSMKYQNLKERLNPEEEQKEAESDVTV